MDVLDYFKTHVVDTFGHLLTGADIGDLDFMKDMPTNSVCGSLCVRHIDKLRDLLHESDPLSSVRRHFIQGAVLNLTILING